MKTSDGVGEEGMMTDDVLADFVAAAVRVVEECFWAIEPTLEIIRAFLDDTAQKFRDMIALIQEMVGAIEEEEVASYPRPPWQPERHMAMARQTVWRWIWSPMYGKR